MAGFLDGAAELIAPSARLLAYLAIVGIACRIAVRRYVELPAGLGTTVGLGLATALPITAVSYAVSSDALSLVRILLPAAGAVVAVAAVVGMLRRARAREPQVPGWLLPDATDLVAAGIALLALLPVIGFGATSWTGGPNDVPNYVASTQIWLSDSGAVPDFASQHPDYFGEFQLLRAGFEKPMATAYLVVASWAAGAPPYQLMTPVLLVAMYVTSQALLRTLTVALPIGRRTAVLCLVPPLFSVVPMSRVHSAQVGHVVALALLGTSLVLLAASRRSRDRSRPWIIGAIAGLPFAAAIGANPTVVLAATPMFLALCWLLMKLAGRPRADSHRSLVMAAACAAVVSLPLSSWYRYSLALQTSGKLGLRLPESSPVASVGLEGTPLALPSPLAMIGLQSNWLLGAGFTVISLVAWAFFAYVVVIRWIGLPELRSDRTRPVTVFALVCLLNVAAIALVSGLHSYGVFKWTTLFIVLAVPFLLGVWAGRLHGPALRRAAIAGSAVAGVSALISTSAGFGIPSRGYVATDDLLTLATDARIAAVEELNIDLGRTLANSMAAVIVASDRLVMVDRATARGRAPLSDQFLVANQDVAETAHSAAQRLNDDYSLVRRNFDVEPGVLDFTHPSPENRALTYGDWYQRKGFAGLASGSYSTLRLVLPASLRSRELALTVVGIPHAEALGPFELRIRANGAVLYEETFTQSSTTTIPLRVPADRLGPEGDLILEFETDLPVDEVIKATFSDAPAGFALVSLEIPRSGPDN